MSYIIQILCFFFAFYSGRHDAPACDKFAESGSSLKQQAVFHSNNWKMKLIVVMMAAMMALAWYWHEGIKIAIIKAGITGVIAWAIVWLVFDISLNGKREGRNWDYLSSSNAVDEWLLKHFSKTAGEKKAIACAIAIVGLNVFMHFI